MAKKIHYLVFPNIVNSKYTVNNDKYLINFLSTHNNLTVHGKGGIFCFVWFICVFMHAIGYFLTHMPTFSGHRADW